MNILVTDDEYLARERVKKLLLEIDPSVTLFDAENGVETIKICEKENVDLVFLDIRMPEMDGLEAAWHLTKLNSPPAVIFVSAYDDYALKAFEVNAIDYILKPVKAVQLEQSLNKAATLNRVQLGKIGRNSTTKNHRQHLSARLAGEIELIPLRDVYYCQAEQKYIKVRHAQGESLIEEPLKQLEQEFSDLLIRIHRNALVNRHYIAGLQKDKDGHLYMVVSECNDKLEVSRRHASAVRKLIRNL